MKQLWHYQSIQHLQMFVMEFTVYSLPDDSSNPLYTKPGGTVCSQTLFRKPEIMIFIAFEMRFWATHSFLVVRCSCGYDMTPFRAHWLFNCLSFTQKTSQNVHFVLVQSPFSQLAEPQRDAVPNTRECTSISTGLLSLLASLCGNVCVLTEILGVLWGYKLLLWN